MIGNIVSGIVALLITALAYQIIPNLKDADINQISSSISAVSGMLFGFLMATFTLLVSATENSLVRNTKQTGYFSDLLNSITGTMISLIITCFIFLAVNYIPDTSFITKNLKSITVLITIGTFLLTLSSVKFIYIWKEFNKFASLM